MGQLSGGTPHSAIPVDGTHFRQVNHQSPSSKTGFILDDLLDSPQKVLIPTIPQTPRSPGVREGLGQIVGEVAVAP